MDSSRWIWRLEFPNSKMIPNLKQPSRLWLPDWTMSHYNWTYSADQSTSSRRNSGRDFASFWLNMFFMGIWWIYFNLNLRIEIQNCYGKCTLSLMLEIVLSPKSSIWQIIQYVVLESSSDVFKKQTVITKAKPRGWYLLTQHFNF